ETIQVKSLLTSEGVSTVVGDAVDNFAQFPPLALIIVVMLGVSVAEQSGLLNAMLRGSVTRVPAKYLTFVVALTGISGSVASDAAYVVLIPLGALVFKAVGRSAILGLVVAFGSISAGYNASLLRTPTDAILSGLTTSAAHFIDLNYAVRPLATSFFPFWWAAAPAVVIARVTEVVLTKRPDGMGADSDRPNEQLGEMRLSPAEL